MSHIPTNASGAAMQAAEHITPSSHASNATSGAGNNFNTAAAEHIAPNSAAGGIQQHIPGQHHGSQSTATGGIQQHMPGQHHNSSSTSTSSAQQHIPGQHHNTSSTTDPGAAAAAATHINPTTHANAATGHTTQQNRPIDNPQNHAPAHPRRAGDIPGELEGPVHKSKLLNELDPRVKAHPGSATTGGHHTIPKIGETHHQHGWKE